MKRLLCGLALVLCVLACPLLFGQQTPAPNRQQQPPTTPQKDATPQTPAFPSKYGQTIFSRSDATTPGETGNGAAGAKPEIAKAPAKATPALVTDAERTALTYSSYDFDVHLEPSQHSLAVHAHLTARNSGDKPLDRIALQLSSSLRWYSIQVNGRGVKFATEPVDSDIDHTGQLTEAVVTLAAPLAPRAEINFNVIYSGAIEESAERLLRLGAPAKVAATSEWDRIGEKFTALRGFGNAIWFPVSTAPVLLGEGSRMFDSVGKWKLRESNARVSMHVLVEYLDHKPSVAFLNGYVVQPDNGAGVQSSGTQATSGGPGQPATEAVPQATGAANHGILRVVSFTLPATTLGFSPLSFFVMDASHEGSPGLDIYSRVGNEAVAPAYKQITEKNRPLVEQWLGPHAKRPVVLVDLSDSADSPNNDLPFEERNILFLPMQANPASDNIGPVLTHMLSHAYFISPREWLDEGVAQFMTLLWIEHLAGRATAIAQMDSRRAALALAEPADPGVDPGQSLIEAWSDIYYRDKAADVLWMLRDMVGDPPFAKALQSYNPADDHEASYLQSLLQKAFGKDLEWFFDDWVYRDRGLPDLHIVSAYRRPILTKNSAAKNYLVSVDVENTSFCAAEVPVTAESGLTAQTKRLIVPSHTRAALRMLLDSEPDRVIVNDGSVPEVRASRHEKIIHAAN